MTCFSSRLCAVVVLAVLAGCGGSRSEVTTTGSGAQSADLDDTDPLFVELRALSERLEAAGLEASGIRGRGFLTHREVRTHNMTISAQTCLSIIALTSRGIRDLDATLYAPDGSTLAEDVEPDAHPTLQVCAGEADRSLYLSFVSYDGAGSYAFAAFEGERASFDRVAELIGGRPGVAETDPEAGGADRLAELARGLARRGFSRSGDTVPLEVAAGEPLRVPLPVERGRCYTVAAVLNVPGVVLELIVRDELDQELTHDGDGGSVASVQLCSDRDAELSIQLRSPTAGRVELAYFDARRSTVGGQSGLWLGEAVAGPSRDIDDVVRANRDRFSAAGWQGPRRLAVGTLVVGQVAEHDLTLAAGRCTLLSVAPGPGLSDVRLRLVDTEGQLLSAARGSIRHCVDQRMPARAQVLSRRGAGSFQVDSYDKPTPAAPLSGISTSQLGPSLSAMEEAEGFGLTLSQSASAIVDVSDRVTRTLPRAAGCVRVSIIADEAVRASLLSDGRAAVRGAGRRFDLRACPSSSGTMPDVELSPARRGVQQQVVMLVFAAP